MEISRRAEELLVLMASCDELNAVRQGAVRARERDRGHASEAERRRHDCTPRRRQPPRGSARGSRRHPQVDGVAGHATGHGLDEVIPPATTIEVLRGGDVLSVSDGCRRGGAVKALECGEPVLVGLCELEALELSQVVAHLGEVVDEGSCADLVAVVPQAIDLRVEKSSGVRLDGIEVMARGYAEDWLTRPWCLRFPLAQGVGCEGDRVDVSGEEADGVQRPGIGDHTVQGEGPPCWAEADDAAEGGRSDDRTDRLCAQCQRDHACRDSGCGPAARPTRGVAESAGVTCRAWFRDRELGRDRLPRDHGACSDEPVHDGRLGAGERLSGHSRSRPGVESGHPYDVLHPDEHPRKWSVEGCRRDCLNPVSSVWLWQERPDLVISPRQLDQCLLDPDREIRSADCPVHEVTVSPERAAGASERTPPVY